METYKEAVGKYLRKGALFVSFIIIAILFLPTSDVYSAEQKNILFILDGSGSMWGQIEGKAKIAIARDVMRDLIQGLPENVNTGLEVYGHRREGDCNDIEVLVSVGKGDKDTLIKKINSIKPKGKTPITKSLKVAGQNLGALKGETAVILVSDGKETCKGDPCKVVKELREKGIKVKVHVVGFDVTDEEKKQLSCIAEAGGGKYFTAKNAGQLKEALIEVKKEIVSAEPAGSLLPHRENTLAHFLFAGNTQDSSEHGRHAKLLGGSFITTYGGALRISPDTSGSAVGLDWSEHARFLRHPYTVEMLLEPAETEPWGKIFGFDDTSDNGWYYKHSGVQAYPNDVLGGGRLMPGELHYLCFISISPTAIEVFYQGESLGRTHATFEAPPTHALFFSDDTATGRREQLSVVVYELRISSGGASGDELVGRWNSIRSRVEGVQP